MILTLDILVSIIVVLIGLIVTRSVLSKTEQASRKEMIWLQKYYIIHIFLFVVGIGYITYGFSQYDGTVNTIFPICIGAVALLGSIVGLFTRGKIIRQQTQSLANQNPALYSVQKNTTIGLFVLLIIANAIYQIFKLTYLQGLLLAIVAFIIPFVYYFYKSKQIKNSPADLNGIENRVRDYGPANTTPITVLENGENKFQSYLIPISIAFAGIVVAGAIIGTQIYLSNRTVNGQNAALGGTGSAGAGQAAAPSVNIKNVATAGEPFIGQADAPVTIAYWSDYQCPFCKQFELSTLSDLITNYVDKGELKIVFKDFPFLGADSTADGEYARAVWILYPNQFFAWRTAMFSTQPEENSLSQSANQTRLQQIAASIPGINPSKVLQYVIANQAALDKQINADLQEGESDGIQGTPSFIVGTQLLVGAEPTTAFVQAIEAELPAGK
jgi:protein-disulfide isomerase